MGGGFLTLYCEGDTANLREAMRAAGLRQLNFRFDFEGSKVIFDVVSRDGRLAHIQRQNHWDEGRAVVAGFAAWGASSHWTAHDLQTTGTALPKTI